jgi:nitroreductase
LVKNKVINWYSIATGIIIFAAGGILVFLAVNRMNYFYLFYKLAGGVVMQIIGNELYENIFKRKSIRSFSGLPMNAETKEKMTRNTEIVNEACENVRIILAENKSGNIFKGMIGSYGAIRDAGLYTAFIGKNNDNKAEYDIGYYGEAFILSAISARLGTCWISGTFNPDQVNKNLNICENERIYAVTPLGYPAESEGGVHKLMRFAIGSAKRKTIDQISNINEVRDKQDWMVSALEALRVAPSAKNIQPWFVKFEDKKIVLLDGRGSNSSSKSMDIEMGIAMLHLELGANKNGRTGKWVYPVNSGKCKAYFEFNI